MNKYDFIPCNERKSFPYYKAKKLFDIYKNEVTQDKLGFTALLRIKKPYFWAVMINGEFKGCYFIDKWLTDKDVYIGGYSKRNCQEYTTKSMQFFINLLIEQGITGIMAETKNRHTAIFLLKNGFKKQSENIYKYGGNH